MPASEEAKPPPEQGSADAARAPVVPATQRWVRVCQMLGACAWLALVTWRLDRVPGMSMDEGWSILSARGQWPPANPLSGMSSYTGPFPVLALRAFGPSAGLLVLRGVSVAAHAALLLTLGLLLRRCSRAGSLSGWALPMMATCPAWLISARIGIDVTMFIAPLVVIGFYCSSRPGRVWAFIGGLSWGLAVYNHLLGLFMILALGGAWVVIYRRWRQVLWVPLLAGLALGLAPRLLAVVLYDNSQIAGTTSAISPSAAIAELRWTPRMYWETLEGRTVYYRYVGRIAQDMVPYWAAALAFVVPWLRHWRKVPRSACFTLLAVVAGCVLTTLGAPHLESRYFVLPVLGLPLALALLGGSAIERDRRWAYLIRAAAGVIICGNLFYVLANFYVPWQRRELAATSYPIGDRSPPIGSWHFLPKEGLVEHLLQIDPPPQQVVASPSLQRPLAALMGDTAIRVVIAAEADRALRSVYVDYRGRPRPRYCVHARGGKQCFVDPTIVDQYFILYRRTR